MKAIINTIIALGVIGLIGAIGYKAYVDGEFQFTRGETISLPVDGSLPKAKKLSVADLIPTKREVTIPVLPVDKHERKEAIAKIVARETEGKMNSIILDALIEQESNYDQFAVSNKGAVGLVQVMPEWVEKCGLKSVGELYDAKKNIACSVVIFQDAVHAAKRVTSKSAPFSQVLFNAYRIYNAGEKYWKGKAAKQYAIEVSEKVRQRLNKQLWAKAVDWRV